MAIEECTQKILSGGSDDENDEAPLVFKRSAPRQSQLSSASKNGSSQKGGVRATSDHRAPNGQPSTSQKVKVATATKLSSQNSTSVGKGSQPRHSSEKRTVSRDIEMTSHLDKPLTSRQNSGNVAVQNSDSVPTSSDDKPLTSRQNSVNVAVQNSDSVQAKSVPKQSSNKPESSDSRKTNGDKPYATARVEPQRNSYTQKSQVLGSSTSSPANKVKENAETYSDDSEDDKPIAPRIQSKSNSGSSLKKPGDSEGKPLLTPKNLNDSDDDDKPLVLRIQSKSGHSAASKKLSESDDERPLNSRLKLNGSVKRESTAESTLSKNLLKRPLNNAIESSGKKAKVSDASSSIKIKHESVVKKKEMKDDDDDDDLPISQRMKKPSSSDKKSPIKKVEKTIKKDKKNMRAMKNSKTSKSMVVPPGSGGGKKWTTLQHCGVIFPPDYKPHGIKMLYNGQPVDLTKDQEEVATMFAVMKETDYASKPTFIENFMNDWRQVLGKNHVIKKFELCDFTPIYEWHLAEKEKKKQMTTEEKKTLKEEKMKQEEKYTWAIVDGVKEKVGNFRVEPPGLFRGRGEHPKMGKLKKRIRPGDITINIGKEGPIPECPIPGERWKEVRHDDTVTWLAYWNDPINPKELKYVFLAASSALKGQSDKEKYEKARLLKDYIQNIRANYTRDFSSKDPTRRQVAVATYLIDKLALRAGNEKDDDEADTVGCCTLKVENVMLVPPNKLQFDFLGKDSIRYFNTVEVELAVYKAIGDFRNGSKKNTQKDGGDDLFDMLDTSKLNTHLKELMPGLTAKVFRTYNASITLDEMLNKDSKEVTLPEKIACYQTANKEVAIICNHQRSVSKSHDAQMSRLNEKIDELKAQRDELKEDLSRARKGKPLGKDAEGNTKRNLAPEALQRKLAQAETKIEKMEIDKKIKEDLKTVALGTSKINYLDPRITVAWCKRQEVPIEKMFNKSLLGKFAWAMDVDPDFRF